MGKALAICSGKGGTGKTSSAAALAASLAERGRLVMAIDCDVGLRNLDLVLGVSDKTVFDFCDVLEDRVSLDEAVCIHPMIPNLSVLSAPAMCSDADIDSAAFHALVCSAKDRFDYVILDAPAGIGPGFRLVVSCADEVVVVTNPDSSSLRDGQRTACEIGSLTDAKIWMLVNRLRRSFVRRSGRNVDRMIDDLSIQLLGIVREDRDVMTAGDAGIPLKFYREPRVFSAAGQFDRIAARLDGERVRLGPV